MTSRTLCINATGVFAARMEWSVVFSLLCVYTPLTPNAEHPQPHSKIQISFEEYGVAARNHTTLWVSTVHCVRPPRHMSGYSIDIASACIPAQRHSGRDTTPATGSRRSTRPLALSLSSTPAPAPARAYAPQRSIACSCSTESSSQTTSAFRSSRWPRLWLPASMVVRYRGLGVYRVRHGKLGPARAHFPSAIRITLSISTLPDSCRARFLERSTRRSRRA